MDWGDLFWPINFLRLFSNPSEDTDQGFSERAFFCQSNYLSPSFGCIGSLLSRNTHATTHFVRKRLPTASNAFRYGLGRLLRAK